jgi:crossover junction endodeoxyribonuclease RuvC
MLAPFFIDFNTPTIFLQCFNNIISPSMITLFLPKTLNSSTKACYAFAMTNTSIILGIDPGSRCTGYGIIRIVQGCEQHVTHGQIKNQTDDLGEKLLNIHQTLCDLIKQYQPTAFAIESVFVNKNVQSALKLGQARAAAILAGARFALAIHEYTPKLIKKAVVGYGAASKQQVQHMVQQILQIKQPIQSDAADALAIAITHAQHQRWQARLKQHSDY